MLVQKSVVHRVLLPVALGLCAFAAFAQSRAFGVVDGAMQLRATMSVAKLRALVNARVAGQSLDTADDHLLNAELMKQLGDPRAPDSYEAAISAAPNAPAYELFYADYLRNYRGPRRPLFGEAEEHYFAARAKLLDGQPQDPAIADRIDRGLVALYQEDGLPIAWSGERPRLFFSSINRVAHSMADLDEVHDMRDFTSEALLASSGVRLNRPLTLDELRSIARVKKPRETFKRLRMRRGGGALELTYQDRLTEAGQITNSFQPGLSNDVKLNTYGAAVEYTTAALAPLDLHWRLAYSRGQRDGVLEFFPSRAELIDQIDARFAAARFVGPDKVHAQLSASMMNIEPENAANPTRHERQIAALTGEYHLLRTLPFLRDPGDRLFAARGVHLRAGVALDVEWFGDVRVGRRDVFAGVSLNGLGPFDVNVAPGLIRSSVGGQPGQTHQHRRLDAHVLLRLLDEERQPGIPSMRFLGFHPAFVHLVFPYKQDVAIEGLDAFENQLVGVMLALKLFRRALPESSLRARPATILFSIRCDRQRFPRLDRSEELYGASISLGY